MPMPRSRRIVDAALVTVITCLIWLYAEGQNVQSYQPTEAVPLTIELTAEDLVVTDQSVQAVTIEFLGATAEIERLRPLLARRGLVLSSDLTEPGDKPLVLREALYRADPIKDLSVNIGRVEPPTMTLVVDRLVRRPTPIAFQPTDVKLVDGSLDVAPQSVTLVAPQSLLQRLGIDDAFRLEVEPTTPLKSLAPGVERTVKARVKLPPALATNPHVSVDPAEVTLTLTIDKAEDTIVVPSVPVWIMAPPPALTEYAVKLDEENRVLQDVKVTGPSDMIQQVRSGAIKVIAVLRLNSDRLAAGVGKDLTETVTLEAPAGLVIEAPNTTVRFSVTRSAMGTP